MLGQIRDTLRDFFHKGDMVLLALCLTASLLSLPLIYSATRYSVGLRNTPVKQAVFVCLGVVIYFFFTVVDIELIVSRWWKLLGVAGIGLILMLIPFGEAGDTINRSWMYLPGMSIGLQPAELVKVPFLLVMAYILDKNREHGPSRPFSVFLLLGYTLLFAGIIAVISGDWGMVLVYLLLFVCMAWAGGVSWKWYAFGGAVAVGGVAVVWPHVSDSYHMKRITVVIDHLLGNQDPQSLYEQTQGVGWQQSHSIQAIGAGQLTGQGFLQGNLTQSAYETSLHARHTDEIFAVCGEEFGMVGCLVILVLLTAILLRCVWVARASRSPLSSYIAMGVASMLLIQTSINVAMCLYLFPVVGLTLPFFSYGGSSVLTMYAAMGIVSGIKMRFLPSWLRDRRES